MFDIAGQVTRWLGSGQDVVLARVVSVTGMSSRWPSDVAAMTTGGELCGSVLGSVADEQLLPALRRALRSNATAHLLDLTVGDAQASAAGLACGGRATVLIQPARDVPAQAWDILRAREPLCLLTDLDGELPGRTTWFTLASPGTGRDDQPGGGERRHHEEMVRLFGRGASTTAVTDLPDGGRALAAALWPTPRLVVVGDGLLADALVDVATLLGWTGSVVNGVDDSVAAVAGLFRGDAVLVLTHERTVDAPVLRAALAGGAGYVGALGSRRTQAARTRWLAEHDVPEDVTGRVRGPAGLDIGARTPHEIAVSIAAEVLAVRAGAAGTPLRDRPGPVHVDGLNAPPPRYDSSPPRRTPL